MEGLVGGISGKKARARAVASRSWPAKTVATRAGRRSPSSAWRTPGRAMPAAQPQTELTTRSRCRSFRRGTPPPRPGCAALARRSRKALRAWAGPEVAIGHGTPPCFFNLNHHSILLEEPRKRRGVFPPAPCGPLLSEPQSGPDADHARAQPLGDLVGLIAVEHVAVALQDIGLVEEVEAVDAQQQLDIADVEQSSRCGRRG